MLLKYSACFGVLLCLWGQAIAQDDVVISWDFENGNDHDFLLWSWVPGDDENPWDDLPDKGPAWWIGGPDALNGVPPAVEEGIHIDPDGLLDYSLGNNNPYPVGENGRGQSGYLDTYALSQWGDNLHTPENNQMATSPPFTVPNDATLQVWSYGSDARYMAPEFDETGTTRYVTGSAGLVVLDAGGSAILESLHIQSHGGGTPTLDEVDLSPYAGQEVRVEVVDAFAGGWGWLAIDEIRILGDPIVGAVCDFDGSGVCDIVDLDELLYTGLGTNDAKYDLDNSGGTIDLADRDAFLNLIGSFLGDFDLDGKVVAGDLNILGGNWQQSGLTSYAQGDANGDGAVNAGDLNALGSNWQKGAGAAALASVVPEPTGMLFVFASFIGCLLSLRRKH